MYNEKFDKGRIAVNRLGQIISEIAPLVECSYSVVISIG